MAGSSLNLWNTTSSTAAKKMLNSSEDNTHPCRSSCSTSNQSSRRHHQVAHQLNRENEYPPVPGVPENLVSRDGFSRPVLRQPAHLHTQAESGAYLRDYSRVPRRRPFMKPPYATGSVPSLSGHAIAYRWRSLPRVRRHRASKSQGSSERVLPWQVTMDQLIFASLSHTHYWYKVGMLKVPAEASHRGIVG